VTITSFGTNLYNTATGSYGSFYDTGSVAATSATTVYSMSLSTTDISNGVYVSGSNNSQINFTNAGTYNIQFSAQFSNTDNSNQDVVVWARKNGTNIPDSSGTVGVPPFKAGSNGQALASWNYYLNLSANDYIQLCWHAEQGNVITLETIAAGTSPTYPRTPSLILTAQRVDTFLSNTGSFMGTLQGTASFASTASFITPTGTNAFVQGGNSFGTQALLGTNDNNNLAFETSGSTRLFISSSGNVGVGITTPSASLHVAGDIRLASAADGTNALWYYRLSSNNWSLNTTNGVGEVYRISGNSQTFYQVGTFSNSLTVTPGGNSTTQGLVVTSGSYPAATLLRVGVDSLVVTGSNVGIGTTTPTVPLEIGRTSGGTQAKLRLWSGNVQWAQLEGGDSLLDINVFGGYAAHISRNGGYKLAIPANSQFAFAAANGGGSPISTLDTGISRLSAGKVSIGNGTVGDTSGTLIATNIGIGKTTPNATLDINGNTIITGSLNVTSNITGSNALFTGTITAQKLVVQTITSSILYSSGSNIFGSQLTDIQSFTGSLRVTGSGNHYVMGGNVGIGTSGSVGRLFVNSLANAITGLTNVRLYANTFFGGYAGSNFDYGLAVGMTATAPIIQAIQLTSASADLSLQPYGGNVGIGVQSPVYRLRIDASGSANSNLPLALTSVDANNRVGILFGSSSLASGRQHKLFHRVNAASVEWLLDTSSSLSANWNFLPTDDSSYAVNILAPFATGLDARLYAAPKHRSLTLSAGGSNDHLTIRSGSGNVGIGTTSFVGNIKLAVNGQIGGPTYSSNYIDFTGAIPELRGNSGIGYYSAAGSHIFYGGSSVEYMRLTTAGLLGIGTATPLYKLDVSGSGRFTGDLFANGTVISNGYYGVAGNDISFNAPAGYSIKIRPNGSIESARFSSNGNVGIGTTSPLYKLDVSGSGRFTDGINVTGSMVFTGNITGSNALFTGTITAQKLVVQQVTSSILYSSGSNIFGSQLTDIQSFTGSLRVTGSGNHYIVGGNVGIGTTTPNAKLDINGNTIITGSLQISASIFQYSNNASITTASIANIASFPTSSYQAGFFDYVASSGTNARAGTIFTVWNRSSIEYSETATNDIGLTNNLILSASLSGANILLQGRSLSGSWSVKTLTRMI
jgi:hypothetical protein